jgi:RNA processing factor Prp31
MDKKTKQQINNLLNSYFKWVIFLVAVFILIAGYILVIKPKYEDTMSFLESQLNLERQAYLQKQKEMAKLEELVAAYNDIDNQNIHRVNTLLPDNYSYERLFTELNEIVSENGMFLAQVDIVDEKKKEEKSSESDGGIKRDLPPLIKTVNVNMQVLGVDYPGFKNLLGNIENNLRLMDITNVEFNPGNNMVEMSIQTYYFDEKKFDVDKEASL